jgi:hypothetical protein
VVDPQDLVRIAVGRPSQKSLLGRGGARRIAQHQFRVDPCFL